MDWRKAYTNQSIRWGMSSLISPFWPFQSSTRSTVCGPSQRIESDLRRSAWRQESSPQTNYPRLCTHVVIHNLRWVHSYIHFLIFFSQHFSANCYTIQDLLSACSCFYFSAGLCSVLLILQEQHFNISYKSVNSIFCTNPKTKDAQLCKYHLS